ncbi:type IV toxin-antitoxin system AbiEi family antitoxin domain-containing protein [Jatrophihabitans telluris]|uniref:Type IV toxin-antitoxin system AbiEi family antitoxin domain-containing protein n=1 Tax=Jatrophihabitans telluris TaxID=2038343 RepID=A0ABY4QWU8_9ACTN|nr:type IV toxin-antitoxin system AbiEi family antitoxin domain-containing protein [Jatrophihabitans telluris]UQX88128.1 type IV toxin-antitoxin system AbiEi family antitoxin domain-containing protein [Jatrophihabitans telluris]
MAAVPHQAKHQWGTFTAEQALLAGWSSYSLWAAVNRGELVRLRRGVYLPAADLRQIPEHRQAEFLLGRKGVAAALAVPRAVVSHRSAAALHGLPLIDRNPTPCVTLEPPLRTRPADLHVHRQPLAASELDRASDIALAGTARTIIDLTRESGLLAGVVAADSALRDRLITATDLENAYARLRGRAGLSDGREILRLASPLSESPLESISRVNMRALPVQPRQQVNLFTPDGIHLGRVDFFFDEAGLVGEADGRAKYDEAEFYREKLRADTLQRHGVIVTRWGWSTAMNPRRLCAQLEADYARAMDLRRAGYLANVRTL